MVISRYTKIWPRVAACLALLFITNIAHAQSSEDDDSTITFPASYFAQFNPTTINDMLDRVPGIELIRAGSGTLASDGDRGLGSESPILIDGRRLAGKANEADSQLARISAEEVDYIEIIRGTSSDLDVQNAGQIVNIVLLESQSGSTFASELTLNYHEDGTSNPAGSVSWSRQSGAWSYLLNGEISNTYGRQENFETSLNGDLSPNENIDWDRVTDETQYSVNANVTYSPSNRDRYALNLLYNESEPQNNVFRVFTDFNSAAPFSFHERETLPSNNENWEIGGDYQHGFENGNRVKALFIVNENNKATLRERFLAGTLGGLESPTLYLDTSSRNRERIVRSSYIINISDNQGLELGIEGAQTILDSSLLLAVPTSGPGNPEFNGLTSVPLPNANSTVEEVRFEPFVIHNWQINSRMSLESSLVAEWSEITQSGDLSNKRDFNFIKPKFDFRYNINNSLQAKASFEKVASQLSFGDFSRNTNPRDDDEDTFAGNPALEPEESLRAEVGLDYRLPNDGGAINARYFYYDFDNKIGRIDISQSIDNLQSTNGNVGPGQAYGLILNSSIRLGFLKLPTALLTAVLTLQESEFDDDPFTPREHGFPPFDRGGLGLGFRHDVTSQNLSYGFNIKSRAVDAGSITTTNLILCDLTFSQPSSRRLAMAASPID
jgi:outer membrane receptor for ferrienterochelin and colicins